MSEINEMQVQAEIARVFLMETAMTGDGAELLVGSQRRKTKRTIRALAEKITFPKPMAADAISAAIAHQPIAVQAAVGLAHISMLENRVKELEWEITKAERRNASDEKISRCLR